MTAKEIISLLKRYSKNGKRLLKINGLVLHKGALYRYDDDLEIVSFFLNGSIIGAMKYSDIMTIDLV